MASPSLNPHRSWHEPKRKPVNYSLIVTVALQLVTWIFAAGMLWQKVNDLEKTVTDLRTEVRQHWTETQHAPSQPAATPGSD